MRLNLDTTLKGSFNLCINQKNFFWSTYSHHSSKLSITREKKKKAKKELLEKKTQ